MIIIRKPAPVMKRVFLNNYDEGLFLDHLERFCFAVLG